MNLKSALGAVLALTLGTAALAAPDDKSWAVSAAKNKAGSVEKIVRYRTELPKWLQRSAYGSLVVISWPTANPAGMPTKDESRLHYAFEDTIQAAQEGEKTGVLAAVVTGSGKVEWYYYAKSHEAFMTVFNNALRNEPRLPIQISLEQDSAWTMHKLFSGGR